jgi:formylglycine-generating enzyme required for sulfatase activity
MGAPADEENASSTEMPQHQVTISHSFYMAKFLTTQAQWVALMGTNPSHFSVANGGSSTDNFSRPVEGVSWNDITKSTSYYTSFMDALNAATTTTRPTGMIFRLPTEAEWEYSCRANTTTRFYWGDDPDYTLIAINAWYLPNSGSSTHPFGQMTENAFGLYDMSGNVSEWCEDWYGPYTAASETNPTGQATGNTRIARGGSWYSFTGVSCRSAYRYQFAPTSSYNDVGFRVVLAAPL